MIRKKKNNDQEFEKSKKEFLEYIKTTKASTYESGVVYEPSYGNAKEDYIGYTSSSSNINYDDISVAEDDKNTAWEYELKQHRRQKMMIRFNAFGSICGIVALGLVIYLEYDRLLQIFVK